MLLQVPEQRAAAENEIKIYQCVQHPNVIQLVDSELRSTIKRDSNPSEEIAFLLFPYHRVSSKAEQSSQYNSNCF